MFIIINTECSRRLLNGSCLRVNVRHYVSSNIPVILMQDEKNASYGKARKMITTSRRKVSKTKGPLLG